VTASHNLLPKDTRLDSWKAIAAFFGKDERTVKRWEKERGLPVRRVPGAGRGTVFAYTSELERWLQGAGQSSPSTAVDEVSAARPPDTVPILSAVPVIAEETPAGKALPGRWPRFLVWALPICAVTAIGLYVSLGHGDLRFRHAFAAPPHHPDSAAQDFYLRGRFYFEKRTPSDLNTAVDAFTQAIVNDPGYAQAYVGLADTYSLLREYSTMAPAEAERRARAAAQKAVELDPNLADAHTSLAFSEFWGFLDIAAADREFRRAIELDPNMARAHHWYATFLIQVLRPQEALQEIERARQLDPSSKAILADKGLLLLAAGRTEEGISLLRQIESGDPSFRSPHNYLGRAYWNQGNYEAALEEYSEEASVRGNDQAAREVKARQAALQKSGSKGLLEYDLALARRAYEQGSGSAMAVAAAYGNLHEREQVLHYIELARQRREFDLTDLALAHEFLWLHSDPTAVGFPPLS
jgi:Tfp pilus assembly protein PilF